MPVPTLVPSASVDAASAAGCDAVVYVAPRAAYTTDAFPFTPTLTSLLDVDPSSGSSVTFVLAPEGTAPGRRLVASPTGPLDRDYDDVRRISDAVDKGVRRARAAGSVRPLLVLSPALAAAFPGSSALDAALAAALAALYVPLTVRAAKGEAAAEPVAEVHFLGGDAAAAASADALATAASADALATAARRARAVEVGRRVARDVGGGDPEAMAPPAAAEYVRAALEGRPGVTVVVTSDVETIRKEAPCLYAVARASLPVARHHPRLVRLEYNPPASSPSPPRRTVYLVGKGICFDTGGVDVKHGGSMAGMSRDKCGAAAAAGFVATLSALGATGVRCVAYLAFARNSIGSDAYTSDEIIATRAGKKILVVNTDAEGRMAMVDPLSMVREEIARTPRSERSPEVVVHTLATLTGHAIIACGFGYTIAVENGPARAAGVAARLSAAGAAVGDPFEVSSLRREDYDFVAPKTAEYDVLQCNTAPSSATPRGHQFPAAFLSLGSGLDAHGCASADPIAFAHLDIAGSSVLPPFLNGVTTGCPVAALAAAYATE
jgi:leucyl aminopeptidase